MKLKLSLKKKAIKFVLIKLAIILVPVCLAIFLTNRAMDYVVGNWECRVNWKESGMEYKYKFGAGCMIKPDQFWIPAKNYRID